MHRTRVCTVEQARGSISSMVSRPVPILTVEDLTRAADLVWQVVAPSAVDTDREFTPRHYEFTSRVVTDHRAPSAVTMRQVPYLRVIT